MAREVTAVRTLHALVCLRSPLHIGGATDRPGTDAALARDGRGNLYLPGTSVTGALRAALGETDRAPQTWGTADVDGLGASRVIVRDAMLGTGKDLQTPPESGRRDGVAIDRAVGSAVDGLFFGHEIVPAGSWARLEIEVHSDAVSEASDLQLLGRVRSVLSTGLRLGARTSRGLGLMSADEDDISVTEVRYDSAASFWQTRRTPRTVTLPATTPSNRETLDVEIRWRPDGPLAVGVAGAVPTLALHPLLEPHPDRPGRLRLMVPGTALAGALRSRAELVCRTLRQSPTPAAFADQLTSTPPAALLFGLARDEHGSPSSALLVPDCASTTTIAATDWAVATAADTDSPPRRVAADGDAELVCTDHVAVDRWTGGASEGQLFSEYEPHGFRFEPIKLILPGCGPGRRHGRNAGSAQR
ncbi:MAG: RAMP superfamily CRISPR-associated protein [Pseudonocardiaceae bacterium]